MSKSKAALFKERVAHLLAERKALRPLLVRYQEFVRWKSFPEERSVLEKQIADLVHAALDFSEEQLRRWLPSNQNVAETCLSRKVPEYQTTFSSESDLSANPVEKAYEQRLIALCDPLDSTLARMLDE